MLANAAGDQERLLLRNLIDDARRELAGLENLWRISCPNLQISSSLGGEGEMLLDHAVVARYADFGSLRIWNDQTRSFCLIAQTIASQIFR
ncbi:hypothetical protein [Rhizobium sp. 11_C7_N12_5]|uniref:hypothetical protein n=1 Tax=Rhizobium sp. 11_C7_N12_5 TaxID=3240770 RepID=UPI003F209BC8